jgi:hypothetical protein
MAPCSADERRAPGAVGVSRPWKTSAIAPALAIHGGLTVSAADWTGIIGRTLFAVPCKRDSLRTTAGSRPPLLGTCVRPSQKSLFAGRHSHRQPGAGGVSPPWTSFHIRTRSAEVRSIAFADAVYKPTAGSRPPLLCTCVFALPMAPCSADERRAPGAVGVSRPWKTSAIAPALAIHGGLTPAALVNMRWSIAKIAFSPADIRTANQERGASAPRGMHSRCELAARKFVALHLQTRFASPRRAHARRSCEHALVHRKNRFLASRHSHRQPGAGGVSPPWTSFHIRTRSAEVRSIAFADAVYKPTAGSRPPLLGTCVGALPMAPCSADERRAPGAVGVSRPWKTSAIAPALAFHGGLTPAALGHVRSSIAKIAFSLADIRTATQERGASAPRGRHSTSELAARKFVALHLQTRFTNPRRAHARRSYARAFVYCRWRLVQRTLVVHQERSA